MPTELTYVCSRPECCAKSSDPKGWFAIEPRNTPTGESVIGVSEVPHFVRASKTTDALNSDGVKTACSRLCAGKLVELVLGEHFNGKPDG